MRMTIDQYEPNDRVDVFPRGDDDFDEFTGRIVDVDLDNDIIVVVDADDEEYHVDAGQIRLTYNERTDETYA
jgi:hypothetical protein